MAEFNNCLLEIQLEAQSPLIHFQADEDHPGVTIRASEVKPKLDRFLIRKLKKADGCTDEKKLINKYSSFFTSKEHMALNYKMEIVHKRASKLVELSPENKQYRYELYYGNVGQEQKKMGVFSDPDVVIFCMVVGLRKLIQENIIEFFLITNFGTMQNKGFGSFLPKECKYKQILNQKQKDEIAGYLLEDIIDSMEEKKKCKKICYGMVFDGKLYSNYKLKNENCVDVLNEIRQFYGIMKSGQNYCGFARSYIYEYMHTKGIDNEKAWMKQKGISPVVCTKPSSERNEGRQDDNPMYVRALLGTANKISYIKEEGKPFDEKGKVNIVISSEDKKINRIPSPIFFKIIKNVVFIVAREVPKEIYGVKYKFENELWDKRGFLKIPDVFDIDDFLEKYVEYYNGQLRREVCNMKEDRTRNKKANKKVVKIKCIDMSELQ